MESSAVSIEPVDQTEQDLATPYRIAVVQISQASKLSVVVQSFGTFPADLLRISHGKTAAAFDFFGPYQATPAQIGCNGTSNNDNPKMEAKALQLAHAAGAPLGMYRHIWFVKNADLQPACFVAGAQGGYWFNSPGFPVNSRVGYVTNLASNELAFHEFEHGFVGPTLNPHLALAQCKSGIISSANPSCLFDEGGVPGGVPQSAWPLGGSTFGQGSTNTYDENPIHKAFWNQYGWLPMSNLTPTPSAVGEYAYELYPDDGPIPAPGKWMTVYIPLPNMPGVPSRSRSLWFDYRSHAQIGLNLEDRPGVYVYYSEDQTFLNNGNNILFPTAKLLKVGSNPANYAGLAPLPSTYIPLPGQPNVSVKAVPVSGGATYILFIKITGPLQ